MYSNFYINRYYTYETSKYKQTINRNQRSQLYNQGAYITETNKNAKRMQPVPFTLNWYLFAINKWKLLQRLNNGQVSK